MARSAEQLLPRNSFSGTGLVGTLRNSRSIRRGQGIKMQTPDAISDGVERLHTEIDLLRAMYETSVTFNPSTSEAVFKSPEHPGAQLVLRLPDGYPQQGKPLLISACDARKCDLRKEVGVFIRDLGDEEGEVLDVIFPRFIDILQSKSSVEERLPQETDSTETPNNVIIWLHHLLATSKRKLAIQPSVSSDLVSGVTKPGYPGVMLFTGPGFAVDQHVAELKSLNWQAFQVKYEADEVWELGSKGDAQGINEVETMAEVVRWIPEGRKDQFLKVMGMK